MDTKKLREILQHLCSRMVLGVARGIAPSVIMDSDIPKVIKEIQELCEPKKLEALNAEKTHCTDDPLECPALKKFVKPTPKQIEPTCENCGYWGGCDSVGEYRKCYNVDIYSTAKPERTWKGHCCNNGWSKKND